MTRTTGVDALNGAGFRWAPPKIVAPAEVDMMEASQPLEQFLTTLLRDAWQLFQKQALTFVLASATAVVVGAVSFGLLAGPLFVGLITMVRRAQNGEEVAVGQVFDRFDRFAASTIALLIIGVAVVIGSMLFVVPGLIAAVFTAFTLPAIVYEDASAVPAIKRSVQIVRANFLQTLVVLALVGIAQTLGGTVVLGLLLTLPLSTIVLTLAFERMAAVVTAPHLPELVTRG